MTESVPSSSIPPPADPCTSSSALLEENDALKEANRRLHEQLEMERGKVAAAEQKHKELLRNTTYIQAQAEQEEEYISNMLLKKIQRLKEEKEHMGMEIDREEEYLSNTLTKKMEQLKREKVEIEQSLEAETEFVSNRLQRRIDALESSKGELTSKVEQSRQEKIHLENFLSAECEFLTNRLQRQMDTLTREKLALEKKLASAGAADVLDLHAEIEKLRMTLQRHEEMRTKSIVQHFESNEKLQKENIQLRRRVAHLKDKLMGVQTQEVRLEEQREIEEERLFNNLSDSDASDAYHMDTGLAPHYERIRSVSESNDDRPGLLLATMTSRIMSPRGIAGAAISGAVPGFGASGGVHNHVPTGLKTNNNSSSNNRDVYNRRESATSIKRVVSLQGLNKQKPNLYTLGE